MRALRFVLTGAVPAGIALVALLNATAINALVSGTVSDGMVLPALGKVSPSVDMAEAARSKLDAKSAKAILDRNPFDHVTGPLTPQPKPGPGEPTPLDLDPKTAPVCEGVRPLVVVGDEDQRVAFASLEVGGKRILRKRGGEVGDREVAYVGRDRVWLQGRTGLCQALLFGDPLAVVVQPPPGPGGAARSAFELEIEKKIQKTGPNEYAIDRSAVDRILEAQQEIMKSRITPEKEGDRVVGMRISGIKPGSVVNMLGIENGDRLETINGYDVSNPEKMLEAYARLRTCADKLTVHLTRGGKPINVDYMIR